MMKSSRKIAWFVALALLAAITIGLVVPRARHCAVATGGDIPGRGVIGALPSAFPAPAARALRARVATNGLAASLRRSITSGADTTGDAARYRDGMAILTALPARLDDPQTGMLRDVLALPRPPDAALSPLAFNGIKNAAAELLLRQEPPASGLAFDFASMADDEIYDEIWRDYCLQMLSICHERLVGREDPAGVAERNAAVDAMRYAAAARDNLRAGTALLGLEAASRLEPSVVPPAEVAGLAVAIASDSRAPGTLRITALRVAGLRRAAEARPAAWELAQVPGDETLRAAAIATLGEVGGDEDKELLRSIAAGTDAFLAGIARNALATLAAARQEAGVQ